MGDKPDKIYYNITIGYDESKMVAKERPTSNATTQVDVLDAIVDNTSLYDMCISKFRLDTFSIPLVIPELKQPQKITDSKIELNYWVKLFTSEKTNEGTFKFEEKKTSYLKLIPKQFNKSYKVKKDKATTPANYISITDGYEIKKPVVRVDETSDANSLGYIDNLDPFCYIYEAQEFVDSMNGAIMELFADEAVDEFDGIHAFFNLSGSKLTYYQKISESPFMLVFSGNLYRYFGAPFNTKQYNDEGGWTICIDPESRNFIHKSISTECLSLFCNPNFSGSISSLSDSEASYNVANTDVGITQTWNACKSIMICSNSLPVKGEYVPINENDGLLIHENSSDVRKVYTKIHNGEGDATALGEVSNKLPSVKVLETYYPLSSSGGDMRTQIIFTNDSIDTGTKLSMYGTDAQLRKFDICVKWLDIFNNMHDLELFPNSTCDIRLAFVKKGAKQDVITNGFSHVLRALHYKYEPELKKPKIFNESKFYSTN